MPVRTRIATALALLAASLFLDTGCSTTGESYQMSREGTLAARSGHDRVYKCGSATATKVIRLVNETRRRHDLPTLRCSRGLTRMAQGHSADMCRHNNMSHIDSRGRSPGERLKAAGFRNTWTGENVAQGQGSAEEVHRDWMNSPGHRKNILNPKFRRIGVGIAFCGADPYWTQNFAGAKPSRRDAPACAN